MNKKGKKIIQVLLFILIIVGFIFVGTRDFDKKGNIDNEKFDSEYSEVDKNNVFVYTTGSDVYAKLKSGTAIIFMGFPSNKWSGPYAEILNHAAKLAGISEILYYNFKEDRDTKSATYQSIVLKLANYTTTLDTGKQNIYAPTLIVVKNGNIIGFDNDTAINNGNITPSSYWSIHKEEKINELTELFQKYLRNL